MNQIFCFTSQCALLFGSSGFLDGWACCPCFIGSIHDQSVSGSSTVQELRVGAALTCHTYVKPKKNNETTLSYRDAIGEEVGSTCNFFRCHARTNKRQRATVQTNKQTWKRSPRCQLSILHRLESLPNRTCVVLSAPSLASDGRAASRS